MGGTPYGRRCSRRGPSKEKGRDFKSSFLWDKKQGSGVVKSSHRRNALGEKKETRFPKRYAEGRGYPGIFETSQRAEVEE